MSPNKSADKTCKTKSTECDGNKDENTQSDNENEVQCSSVIPKKPFLKRGTGLARYGLNLDEVKKKTGKLKFHKPIKSIPSKIKVPRKCLNQVQPLPKTEFGKIIGAFVILINV